MRKLMKVHAFFAHHPLTKASPFAAWRRFISFQIQSRLFPLVEYDWIGGSKLIVSRGMTGATGNIYVGLHEFYDMITAIHYLRPGDLFLDIGANVGTYTVLASKVSGADVWCFEPDGESHTHLLRNIAANPSSARITAFRCALGDVEGVKSFTVGKGPAGGFAAPGDADTVEVPVRRLDDVVGDAEPAFAKVDVEGAEAFVIAGAARTLARGVPNVIALETVDQAVETALRSNGFRKAFYDPFRRTLSETSFGFDVSNQLFIRDWPKAEARFRDAPAVDVLGEAI